MERPPAGTYRGAMTTLAARADGLTARYHRVPWSPAAWRQALYLVGGIPAQLIALAAVVLSMRGAPRAWPLPLIALAAVFAALPLLT